MDRDQKSIAGYERISFRELRVRWRGLVVRLEVGHEHVSRGMLQTVHDLHKEREGDNLAVGPGSRERNTGYETNNCGELRVRWWVLCALGEGGQNISVLGC